jgi:thymidylate synthase
VSIVSDRYIVAANLSVAWLDAVTLLRSTSSRKVVHLIIRILDPLTEDQRIRAKADQLIHDWNGSHTQEMPDIETTRNTIFPLAFAKRTHGPEELADYYRKRYSKEGLLGFRNNERGTYFGRLVAYPRADSVGAADQLTETVRKLRQELSGGAPKSSRYEINIFNERLDRSPMSFPCLAHLSLHVHEEQLHLQAIYRNESLVARAYGNFLGLAQLQCYLARAVNLSAGELLVTSGHVELEGAASFHRRVLD